MKKYLYTILPILGFVIVSAVPAQAQLNRTWVSHSGDDDDTCTVTSPCRTFAGALTKTNPGGEINVLTPGDYGTLNIFKSVSIISQVQAGVSTGSGNGIVVNTAPNDKVLLEGLDIEGFGTGLNGVRIVRQGKVTIRKCSIRNFSQNGGVSLEGMPGARVVIQDSILLNNKGGVLVQGVGGAANVAFLERTTLDNNTNFALKVATGSSAVLIGSTLTGSAMGIVRSGTAHVISYGNNVIRNGGTPTETLPLQ